METKLLGRWGEELAADYLKKKRYRIVGMNYACRMGEIDIIAENRRYLVFAEVKLRRSADFARPMEYVTAAKRERLRLAAALYLAEHPTEKPCRFDILEVLAPQGRDTPAREIHIDHIENAFEED